jgi:uncharacterized protein YodC (DUF2158 family)
MIQPKFNVGDCVMLPSGGYKMTVTKLLTKPVMSNIRQPVFTGIVECKWFENNSLVPENVHTSNFPQDALIASAAETDIPTPVS